MSEKEDWMIKQEKMFSTQVFESKYFGISADWIAEWEEVYAPLNVIGELQKMVQWLDANPRKRKKHYQRFIINWLNRAHAQVVTAQTLTRVQAKSGAPTERVGCWVDGRLVND